MSDIYEIKPHIKDYSWGSNNNSSWVGKIANSVGITAKSYAEAWFGEHQNGSATYQGKELNTLNLYPLKLEFLGKILSISKPLSIQVHPEKNLAKQLHELNPIEFKDPIGKEEGAIALSKLEIAHSLVNKELFTSRLQLFPELSALLNNNHTITVIEALNMLLGAEDKNINNACKKLWSRLKTAKTDILTNNILKLEDQYPQGDVGVFILMLMNIIELQPGEAIYTPTGCPHAYLSGELIEIMEPSDNVIRCGLTNKKIDRENFMNALLPHQSYATIVKSINSRYKLGRLFIDLVSENKTILPDNKPVIIFSLDASGKLISNDCEKAIIPLSSFLIIRDKIINIKLDTGRVVIFGCD